MTVVVREARAAEVDETARVLASAFEQYRPPTLDSPDREVFDRYLEQVVDVRARLDSAILFVAIEGGRVLGTGTLYPPGRAVVYTNTGEERAWPSEWASLRLLGVDPAHHRRGIGRMLVEARIARARELRARAVALHTSKKFSAMCELLQRTEWKRTPEYDHVPVPAIVAEAYVLALDEG
jgi:GNAT superfamily N-acetyltransferase